MPIVVKATSRGRRHKLTFPHQAHQTRGSATWHQNHNSAALFNHGVRELGTKRAGVHEMAFTENGMASQQAWPLIPHLFQSLPPLRDFLATETSMLQEETVEECLEYLTGTKDGKKHPVDLNEYGLPHLERAKHINFLEASLKALPARFVAYDASRPWIVYWALNGLTLLGEDVSRYREGYWIGI